MIKVYILNVTTLNDEKKYQYYQSIISPYRLEKISKVKSQKDKNLSLGVAILLDFALKEYGLKESEMSYSFNEYGKPYFSNNKEIFFNTSDSNEYALLAISNHEVGCDIEVIGKNNIKVANRFFTNEENELLNNYTPDEFYSFWTRKEAYLKLIGTGLFNKLNSFSVSLDDCININAESIFFKTICFNRYKISIASKFDDIPSNIVDITNEI